MTRETQDRRADRLLERGLELVTRVRDDDPQATGRWLDAMPADDVRDMAILVAALVPEDRPTSELLAWWNPHRQAVADLTDERYRPSRRSA